MSSHRLEIESGRWGKPNSIPLEERKSAFCQVLDEYHFVLECPAYKDLRKQYISQYYWRRQSMFKFIDLINFSNINCIRKLCVFVFHAFKLRSDLLYGAGSRN